MLLFLLKILNRGLFGRMKIFASQPNLEQASKKQLENRRLTATQDLTWALINSPSFLFNR